MQKNKLKVGGKEYPCRVTMGAMTRFQDETGHDVSLMEKTNVKELCIFIYCCVKSACAADKQPFDMDFQSFADNLEPEIVNSFYVEMDGQKKAARPVDKQ